MSLLDLFVAHRADKGHPHAYHVVYEALFSKLRDAPITLLEIGAARGSSARAWRAYFTKAKLVFIDITDRSAMLPEGCIFEHGSQNDPAFLQTVIEKHGPFDVIIDDGSHLVHDQMVSYETLWPHLKQPGLYAIEDVHAAIFRPDHFNSEGAVSTFDHFCQLASRNMLSGAVVEIITFYKAAIFIIKPADFGKHFGLDNTVRYFIKLHKFA